MKILIISEQPVQDNTLGDLYKISESEILVSKIVSAEKSFGDISPYVIELFVSFGVGCSASMLASWLYEKFGKKSQKIVIDETEVELEVTQIEKIIRYKIKSSSGSK